MSDQQVEQEEFAPFVTLDSDEVEAIERFKIVLQDIGVQTVLALEISLEDVSNEFAAQALGSFLRDIDSTDAASMHEAGVSFSAVFAIAQEVDIFPSDFLPTEDTVDKCVDNFWASKRPGFTA